jgi:8-oxo-dGTP pyrophosphatase MutT (NUDIX family)
MGDQLQAQRIAAKAVIEAEGGILVLHPSAIDLNRKWHIPGGIRDDIMENIQDTAAREVREETGIDLSAEHAHVVKVGEWPAVDKGEKVRILAVFFHYKLAHRPNFALSHEHDEYAWLTHQNYKNYEANKEVYELVESLLK